MLKTTKVKKSTSKNLQSILKRKPPRSLLKRLLSSRKSFVKMIHQMKKWWNLRNLSVRHSRLSTSQSNVLNTPLPRVSDLSPQLKSQPKNPLHLLSTKKTQIMKKVIIKLERNLNQLRSTNREQLKLRVPQPV